MNLAVKMKQIISRPGRNQHGQTAVFVGMAFIGLLAFVGLAVDGGLLFVHRVWLRDAFDAAALAGAYELPNENRACSRVVEYLQHHGYTPNEKFSFQIIFPEGNELDSYPIVPNDPIRVINSPEMQDCLSLSIAGDHYEVWVTGTQLVDTLFMGIVGKNTIGTGTPAVAERPELFDVVFVIPNPDSMRHDSCLYGQSDSYLVGQDLYGSDYACTPPYTSVGEVGNAIVNGGFEEDIDFTDGNPGGWTSNFPSRVARSSDALTGSWSVELTNSPPNWCFGPIANRQCADVIQTVTTDATDLYLGFWIKSNGMESGAPYQADYLNLEVRWDSNGDGIIDTDGSWPEVTQFCDWYHADWEPCRFCPDQFDSQYHFGGDYRAYECYSHIAPGRWHTGWEYVVAKIPEEAWVRPGADPIEIRFWNQGKDDGGREGGGSSDKVLIDDVVLYSAPWLQGPKARYIMGSDVEGRASCNNVNDWPNCDNTYSPPRGGNTDPPPDYGGIYTPPETSDIPDTLFPARWVMQQPLYDVLLAIGKDPAMGGPKSFLDILGPGHRFGFVLYRTHTYLNGCVSGPMNNYHFQSETETYDQFRGFLFNGVSSYLPDIAHCGNTGGLGLNQAGGIAGARKLLNENGREHTNRVIVLLSHGGTNVVCGEHSDTYCYGQTYCSPGDPQYEDCINQAKFWIDSQVQHAVSDGITIFAIGLGAYADMDLMQRIAEPTGGTWHHATSTSELPQIFAQINQDMEQIVRLTR